jgi:hypothetical protein
MYRYQTNGAFEKLQNTAVRPRSRPRLISSLPIRPFPQTTAHGRSHCQAGPALPVSPSPPVLLPISPCAPNKTPSSEQLNCSAHTASPFQSARKTASGAGEKKSVKNREELLLALSLSRSLARGLVACPIAGKPQTLVFQGQGQRISRESTSKQTRLAGSLTEAARSEREAVVYGAA